MVNLKKFYLKEIVGGRLVLDKTEPTKNEKLLETIEASSWIKAREKVHSDYYVHRFGHGYFSA